MPLAYLRKLASIERQRSTDLTLARYLTFVAGATNAGGFLAVQQYTSHMSGIVASIADNIVLGNFVLAVAALGALLSFVLGAACTAVMVNWGRRRGTHSVYALPLMLEAGLLLSFGVVGANLSSHLFFFVSVTVMLLCFLMGLQNALVTKISKTEIRTTHVTGLITDLGIELGKLIYWNMGNNAAAKVVVRADRAKMQVLASLASLFFLGCLTGAIGFKLFGFVFTLPLALLLVTLAIVPVVDDLLAYLRQRI